MIDCSIIHLECYNFFMTLFEIYVNFNQVTYFYTLQWGAKAFKNLTIVPPGTGIVHQVLTYAKINCSNMMHIG